MTDSHATLERARALHRQGRLPEAVPLYREVLNLEPRNVDALQLLGVALASMGDLERATVLLSAAAQLAPHSAGIQANLGGALSGRGRWQEALAAYEHALRSEPRLAAALRGQAAALMQLGRPRRPPRPSAKRYDSCRRMTRPGTAWAWCWSVWARAQKRAHTLRAPSSSMRPTPRHITT